MASRPPKDAKIFFAGLRPAPRLGASPQTPHPSLSCMHGPEGPSSPRAPAFTPAAMSHAVLPESAPAALAMKADRAPMDTDTANPTTAEAQRPLRVAGRGVGNQATTPLVPRQLFGNTALGILRCHSRIVRIGSFAFGLLGGLFLLACLPITRASALGGGGRAHTATLATLGSLSFGFATQAHHRASELWRPEPFTGHDGTLTGLLGGT